MLARFITKLGKGARAVECENQRLEESDGKKPIAKQKHFPHTCFLLESLVLPSAESCDRRHYLKLIQNF
jgi:hypothetical protein